MYRDTVMTDPIYQTKYPEDYPWDKVINEDLRKSAQLIVKIIKDPSSPAIHGKDWEQKANGLKIALRLMSRYAPI